ncbi:MAG: Fe-S cluster assembly protein SufD [Oculatellaceae cyanobacterium Prado106]|jgi:Fe-S cluster assembly protein SufD|nr:Fe-S cluster assembly protein SufD [Oculatellaceae cyanobacterium Prado106]
MSIQVSTPVEELEAAELQAVGLSAAAQKRQDYLAKLLNLAKSKPLDVAGAAWVQALRDQAANLVQEQMFPSTRDEEWRFTDLADLLQVSLQAEGSGAGVTLEAIAPYLLPEAATSRLVFVDGHYAPELSAVDDLPETLLIGNLGRLATDARLQPYLAKQAGAEELFTALNTAGMQDAAVLFAPKNLVVETPIHLLFITTAGSVAKLTLPRTLVIAEPQSALTILEEYVTIGEGTYLTTPVSEIWVSDNAQVHHSRIQRDHASAFHIGKTAVSQERDARYTCNAISLGAQLSRHHLEIYQTGEQTETHLNGLTLIRDAQVGDLHSTIALTQPYGVTRQLQKCIVGDRAHAVFNGKVFVPKLAQQTDAGQLNRNLLLSPKARVDTKPQLEIVADNVKCTHGATVSQLDDDEVFYLQSRGIDAATAQTLLVYAFAYEILDQIPVESLKQSLSAIASQVV